MPAEATTLPLIGGRYRLLRLLAIGGMGEIYLASARDDEIEGLEQLVVIKRILPEFAADPNVVTMFLVEARIAARLDHPNVVRVYDMGRADGSIYFTMEYLHGADLGQLIERARGTRDGFPLRHAVTIALGICDGLHFAHEMCRVDGRPMGIVHRDVSPSNVFVTYHGEVKLVDFGIAKVMSSTQLTQDGMRKGKLAYMSPEQVRGEAVDRRSDIFAIGILLYEMVTLTHLFDGDSEYTILEKIACAEVPPPSQRRRGVAPALEAIILKALALDPNERYATAYDLAEDLDRFAREHQISPSHLALRPFLKRVVGDVPFPWYTDEQLPEEAEAVESWFRGAQPEGTEVEIEDFDVSLSGMFELDDVFAASEDELTPLPAPAPPAPPPQPPPAPPRPRVPAHAVLVGVAVAALSLLAALLVRRCRAPELPPPEPPPAASVEPAPELPPPLPALPPQTPPVVADEADPPIIVADPAPDPAPTQPKKKKKKKDKKSRKR